MAKQSDESHDSEIPTGALGEISQGPGAFETFLDQHHKKILVLGLLAALGVAGYVVREGITEGRETAGGNALQQANDLTSLQDVLKNHGESQAAGSAAVLLAEKQWEENQQDAAVATLRGFIEQAGDHPAKPAAMGSLASKLAAQGKSGEAVEMFQKIADDRASGAYLAPYALISLGDLALAANDHAKAEGHFTRVRNDFATSPFASTASQRLRTLNASLPDEVAPPEPEVVEVVPEVVEDAVEPDVPDAEDAQEEEVEVDPAAPDEVDEAAVEDTEAVEVEEP